MKGFEDDVIAPIAVTLDPNDPFDAVLIDVVLTNRGKRASYTSEGASPFENFSRTEDQCGLQPGDAIEVLIATKQSRLRALRTRGGVTDYESEDDTLLDRAVYAIIALARRRFPDGRVSR